MIPEIKNVVDMLFPVVRIVWKELCQLFTETVSTYWALPRAGLKGVGMNVVKSCFCPGSEKTTKQKRNKSAIDCH